MDNGGEFGRDFVPRLGALLSHLVADAPENDTRMIAVAADQGAQVFVMPFREQQMIVISLFAPDPAVKRLIHHHHPQAVAEIQQLRGGRVVAGANGVAPHFLEQLDLALQCANIQSGSQSAEIMVIANAIQRHARAIEKKAIVRAELDRANSKGCFKEIGRFPIH